MSSQQAIHSQFAVPITEEIHLELDCLFCESEKLCPCDVQDKSNARVAIVVKAAAKESAKLSLSEDRTSGWPREIQLLVSRARSDKQADGRNRILQEVPQWWQARHP